jgi:N-acetylglucosaminyl-diphospho-decaprenol L-rhamnosyltransferase
MKSAVVIVNWNSGERLARCLESLPKDAEVVVVDNASEDESLKQAKAARPTTTFIANNSNLGLAAALNQGIAATRSSYVMVLNPDITVPPDSIESLEAVLDRNAKAGAVGGYVNEKYLPRKLATPWTVIRENLGMPAGTDNNEKVGQAAAAALLVRREASDAIGGFDGRFVPAWYEDVDFCKSLTVAGWEVRFAHSAKFIHEGGYSARTLGATAFAAAYYRNQLRYISKHFSPAAGFFVRLSIVVGMTVRMLAKPSRAAACWTAISGALGGW